MQHRLVPAKAEPFPLGHAPLGRVEAEDDHDEDRDVQEEIDQKGVAAEPALDEAIADSSTRSGTARRDIDFG
jgi:hypothetical protein